jgi:hypothetical protein
MISSAARADDMPGMSMDHEHMGHMHMTGMYGSYPMTREASGTSWQPDSSRHEGLHVMAGDWMLMFHGFVNGIYDHQSGPRGFNKFFSTSMFMTMAQHPLGPGTLGLRSMLSLDPAMGSTGYPELLQTGETANGQTPLIDRQHPHDLFMELAATYSVPIEDDQSVYAYFGLPGEPALGPATFMHRFSGVDNPMAPITHHWLDSTHITYGVATAGYVWDKLKLEGSTFKGREPDQYRWDIEDPKFDSYSGRLTYNVAENWSMQASMGYLVSPEQLEPENNQHRLTGSVTYNKPLRDANWGTTLAWGQDNNTSSGRRLDAWLLESAVVFSRKHTVFARAERVQKDDLFLPGDPMAGQAFTIGEGTVGYIRDFAAGAHAVFGVGGLGTIDFVPTALESTYGKKNPLSFMLFVRAKLI